MSRVQFRGGSLNIPPTALCVVKVEYHTCVGGEMTLSLHDVVTPTVKNGCVEDAWWVAVCHHLPPRYVRLIDGMKSLQRLVFHYGLMDGDACVNSSEGTLIMVPTEQALATKAADPTQFPFSNPVARTV